MKLFIGMLAYNSGPIIEAAIKSTYDYAEKIIVVDGGPCGPSTDNTVRIARACGKKVEVWSGTFRTKDGAWTERDQRQTYIDNSMRGDGNWLLLQDSDEVYDDDNMQKMIRNIEKASPETMGFSTYWIHFFHDLKHIIVGGDFSQPRWDGVYRLTNDVYQLSLNQVGTFRPEMSWSCASPPIHCVMYDVFFYHYGHALSKERREYKVKTFVEQGMFNEKGYGPGDWERFKAEKWDGRFETELQDSEKRESFNEHWVSFAHDFKPVVHPYSGGHPKEIVKIAKLIWGKECF